jgi:hypothetical protein
MRASGWRSSLVDAGWLNDLEKAARSLPRCLDGFGFELRLDGGNQVDFGVVIAEQGRAQMKGRGIDAFCSAGLIDSRQWKLVRELCERWTNPRSLESECVPHVFLEFDTSQGFDRLGSPSIFLGISINAQFSVGGGSYAPGPGAGRTNLVPQLISRLLAADGGTVEIEALEQRIRSLPVGSLVLHVGVMIARAHAVRLHVGVPRVKVADYLRTIGACRVAIEVERLAERYRADDPVATLQFEVQQDCEAVGLELSPGSALEPQGAQLWRTLLRSLVDDGLCAPERYEALLSWSGVSRLPRDLSDSPCTVHRDLSHVKVTLRPDRPPQAKAYLSVVPSFQLFAPK